MTSVPPVSALSPCKSVQVLYDKQPRARFQCCYLQHTSPVPLWPRLHFNGRGHALVASTVVGFLRRVMAEAVRRGFVDKNPLTDLRLVKPKHKEKPEITADEGRVMVDIIAS